MDARTSKLGEYLMYAADFNRYEVFAGTSSNYATIRRRAHFEFVAVEPIGDEHRRPANGLC
ncbi:MAG: hypothetical protein AMK75_07585 [Planctomycetes bacterium SM23_65]|nr:MAG: hypothetical protein AMK75_07585 [Planctomycetes bacterium SM23_65]